MPEQDVKTRLPPYTKRENIGALKQHYSTLSEILHKGPKEYGYFAALRSLVEHREQVKRLKKIKDQDLKDIGADLESILNAMKSPRPNFIQRLFRRNK